MRRTGRKALAISRPAARYKAVVSPGSRKKPISGGSLGRPRGLLGGGGKDELSAIQRYLLFLQRPTPKEVEVVALNAAPVFPGVISDVILGSKMCDRITNPETPSLFGAFLRKNVTAGAHGPVTDVRELHEVGSLCVVSGMIRTEHGQAAAGSVMQVGISGIRRIRITGVVPNRTPLTVTIEEVEEQQGVSVDPSISEVPALDSKVEADATVPHRGPADGAVRELSGLVAQKMFELMEMDPNLRLYREFVWPNEVDLDNPRELADICAAALYMYPERQQAILECQDILKRLKLVFELMEEHIQTHASVDRLLHEYTDAEMAVLNHESKNFSRQLVDSLNQRLASANTNGIGGPLAVSNPVDDLRSTMAAKHPSERARLVFDEELSRLSALEKSSSEYHLVQNYLEWLAGLPWGLLKEEKFDLTLAKKVLDSDHYGLKEVKERILEITAVGLLRGTLRGRILCLVGPPGVGKTSIASSIARSLGRDFFRVAVGGLSDVSEIKGHRRTYVGSMPGKFIQGLRNVSSSNPVILIDEIDKMGLSHQGDPSSALLEVLDPEQNGSFLDHYLDVPYDLSQALFVCTANSTDSIPRPLLDRMEVVQLPGYLAEEKMAIARNHLLPRIMTECGLEPANLSINASALELLIDQYCREPGVRRLEQLLDKIARKAAVRVAAAGRSEETAADKESQTAIETVKVTRRSLAEYVGKPEFTPDEFYGKRLPVGVVMGLAWTSMGGASLYVESVPVKNPRRRRSSSAAAEEDSPASKSPDEDTTRGGGGGGGSVVATGRLGDTMSESVQIAKAYAKNFLYGRLDARNKFFDTNELHLHFPEGGTPKDGPSAGVTIVTSLLSTALRVPVRNKLAMTGELTLLGRVLPIGGVKEKTLAARRAGVKTLVFPKANQRDWDELEAYLREGIEAHFVNDYEEVFALAFPDVNLQKNQVPESFEHAPHL